MTKLYLAGRITGNAGYREEFDEAARFYEGRGFIALNPATLPEGMEKADYMRICMAMIDSADAVVMLPDWEMSQGARLEKAYADYISKAVILHEDQLDIAAGNAGAKPDAPAQEAAEQPKRRSIFDKIMELFMPEEF